MRVLASILVVAVGLFAGALLAADAPPAGEQPKVSEKRAVLSEHETVARLTGVAYQQCRGMTSLCPDNCGQSGDFATFEIVGYLSYKKLGEYGDPQGTNFVFQIQDNHKNPKAPKDVAEKTLALAAGDYVLLNWRHEYVTRTEGGGSSSFPERPVTKLEKITKEEGERLLKQAATQPTSRP